MQVDDNAKLLEKLEWSIKGIYPHKYSRRSGNILEDIENVRKAPRGKMNIPAENLGQGRLGLDHETDISNGCGYISPE